jgi:phage gpG-like protein
MNSIKVVSSDLANLRFVIAPDAGTSPAVTLAGGRAKRTTGRSPPHNVLGYWIENGTSTMRARPFMGLTPEQEKQLLNLLDKAKLFSGD